MQRDKLGFMNAIMKNHYSGIAELEIASRMVTEYKVPNMEPIGRITYEDWLKQTAGNLSYTQIDPFMDQTKLERLEQELAKESCYVVTYRLDEKDTRRDYQLVFCYASEDKDVIIMTKQDITAHMKEHNDRMLELEKDSARFRFIVTHLCENFGEIHADTGNTWMTTCNDWEVSQGNLREQIAWFADNLIVPEQKEQYRKDFELENLKESLRKNNGFYAPSYEAIYPEGRRHLLIMNGLLSNPDNLKEDYIFGFVQDITQLKQQEEKNKRLLDISQELLALSQTDSLTKLYNRIAGEKKIEEYLQEKSKYALAVLLVIDIDYFKKFNDQYGHPVGDTVLKYLAVSMQNIFASSDIICRWGGDEFVIFMPDIKDRVSIENRIELLQEKMRKHRYNHSPLPITLSIGGAVFKGTSNLPYLYQEADRYLYEVKNSGRAHYELKILDMN